MPVIVSGIVNVTAYETDVPSDLAWVELSVDGTLVERKQKPTTPEPIVFAWDSVTVPDGPHVLSAVAADQSGNQGGAVNTISVDVLNGAKPPDTVPPVVVLSITGHVNLQVNSNNDSIPV